MFTMAVENVMRTRGVSADEARAAYGEHSPRRTPITPKRWPTPCCGCARRRERDHRTGHRDRLGRGDAMAIGAELRPGHFGGRSKDASPRSRSIGPSGRTRSTFESYAELTDTFRALTSMTDVRAVVLDRRGRELLLRRRRARDHRPARRRCATRRTGDCCAFTRMTGDLVKAMRACPQPIVAADRRHLRRRGRDPRDGERPALRHAAQPGRVPLRRASACPAPTWGRARSCRASSARGAPASCSTPAASWTATRPSAGASTTARRPEPLLAEATALARDRSPRARPSRTR